MNARYELSNILTLLTNGRLNKALSPENIILVSNEAKRLLDIKGVLSKDDVDNMNMIISISQIVYNNTDRTILFLDDGVYDLLLELDKQYNPNYQIGSPLIYFDNDGEIIKDKEELIDPMVFIDEEFIEDAFYYDNFTVRPRFDMNFYNRVDSRNSGMSIPKKNVNVPHNYPKLVGSLDKCKFVLNAQARDAGVFDDPNVKIFERDFLAPQLNMGLFGINDELTLIAEIKYDGVSVEADVTDHIISARSRGDANNDIAADLTPIFAGMKFPFAPEIPEEESFGIKFEAIMNYHNLERYSRFRNKSYKNSRNTIVGLLGSTDAYDFRDLITLVPLETSLEIDPIQEIEFMNKYYQSGEPLRYAILRGNYYSILYQVKKFVEEAEYMRSILPFMYDGVVIHHTDPRIRQILGRENSINKYSMAIKFNPLSANAVFTGYSYTVGQNGVITPMIHYTPVEFYGTIHDKSSGHSYARFKSLNLAIGDVLTVKYVNDVMPYVYKADIAINEANTNPPVEFINTCPSCGEPIYILEGDKQAVCKNINCPQRVLSKVTNMVKKLNLKDFAEASLTVLKVSSLKEIMELTYEDLKILGPTNAQNFLDNIAQIKNNSIYDYQLLGAIGFSDVAVEKWKKILTCISVFDIVNMDKNMLYDMLVTIKGIGNNTALTIITERDLLMEDLIYIINMPNLIISYGRYEGKKIRFTGIRDIELVNFLNSRGHSAGEGTVTKDTDILIVPYEGHTSKKTEQAVKYGITIIPYEEFSKDPERYLL